MSCIKTGCHAYIASHHRWIVGDVFFYDGIYIFRIVDEHDQPIREVKHFQISEYINWFDRDVEGQTSTLVAREVINLGQEGVPINKGE